MNRYQRYKLYNLPDCLCDIVESYRAPNKFKDVLSNIHILRDKVYNYIIKIYENCAISMFGQHDHLAKVKAGCFKKLEKHIRLELKGICFAKFKTFNMLTKEPHEIDKIYLNVCLKTYIRSDKYTHDHLDELLRCYKSPHFPKKIFGFFKILEYSARSRLE